MSLHACPNHLYGRPERIVKISLERREYLLKVAPTPKNYELIFNNSKKEVFPKQNFVLVKKKMMHNYIKISGYDALHRGWETPGLPCILSWQTENCLRKIAIPEPVLTLNFVLDRDLDKSQYYSPWSNARGAGELKGIFDFFQSLPLIFKLVRAYFGVVINILRLKV